MYDLGHESFYSNTRNFFFKNLINIVVMCNIVTISHKQVDT